ncbi:MAG: hypothetical protein IID61_16795 [SAR324 cluster bacterium]|nr:hypothetical protein [SAR324 cluster bacterium]
MPPKRHRTKARKRGRPGSPRPVSAAAVKPADLGPLLQRLPTLACEPELARLEMAADELDRALAAGEAAPDVIGRLAGPAFHARLLVRLNDLKVRALADGDEPLRFLIESAVYYIEEIRGPPWDNPLVVAYYYRDVAQLAGTSFGAEAAIQAVKAYEAEFQQLLEQKLQAGSS